MIPVDFTFTICVLISFGLILVFGLWIFYNFNDREVFYSTNNLARCHFCTYIFFTHKKEALLMCPRCKSYIAIEEKEDS
jgi:hypothetical protein